MSKIFIIFISLLLISCQNQQIQISADEKGSLPIQTQISQENVIANTNFSNTALENEKTMPKYPGISIDQEFSFIEEHSFTEADYEEKEYSVNADNFLITIKNFAPKFISQSRKTVFNFKTLYSNDYHSNIVGISHLLGENSKEIYVVAVGPGAVCCTNYWITDVSKETPRSIFRSEDFGSFRSPMEVFDADGDGIYELVQFDSAFRYFLDDCGSCSPEPRAVFKYNKKSRTYLPAKNLQQDFVKKSFLKTEKWLAESDKKLKKNPDPELILNFYSRSLDYVVDLFYLGEERKAWKAFDNYIGDEKIRTEIKKRLKQSKFFQALRKTS